MAGQVISSFYPPLPPTTEENRFDQLRLLRSFRVGPVTYRRLIGEYGSASKALEALPKIATAAGIARYRPCPAGDIAAELRSGEKLGARLIFQGEPDFPEALTNLSDAPVALWIKGRTDALKHPSVAIVGARQASSTALRLARQMAKDLATAGFWVVSGLAKGVDKAAHLGALEGSRAQRTKEDETPPTNSATIAVFAGGLRHPSPQEHSQLAAAISEQGLWVSDQPLNLSPQPHHFAARNRLISGLSLGTVVIEAAIKSGSMITARLALDQGKEVMAVPGHPFDGRMAGCNALIRDGARLVRSARDVIDELPPRPATARNTNSASALGSQFEEADAPQTQTKPITTEQIVHCLLKHPLSEDQLTQRLRAPHAALAPLLAELELSGQISRGAGGILNLSR